MYKLQSIAAMAENKTTVLTIKHHESTHTQEITQQQWEGFQDRVQAKYKITSKKEITTPAEVAKK